MYNSPNHRVGVLEEADGGGIDREYDKSSSRTSMINNEVRVYKGGSWKDRDYWLDPAQRRYFPQDMATDYIGFRCAMSRVGSKTQSQKELDTNSFIQYTKPSLVLYLRGFFYIFTFHETRNDIFLFFRKRWYLYRYQKHRKRVFICSPKR